MYQEKSGHPDEHCGQTVKGKLIAIALQLIQPSVIRQSDIDNFFQEQS
jgi:hypothetical protein